MPRLPDPLAPDLAEAAEHFAHWRRTRATRSEPTPAPLRERAVALLSAHRPSTVAHALGINTVMLERWSSPNRSASRATPSHFVALPDLAPEPAPPSVPSTDALPELALRWPGGAELIARGAIPRATLAAILESFAAGGAGSGSASERCR